MKHDFYPFLPLFSSGTPIMHRLFLLMVSHNYCKHSSFLFIIFFSFCSSDWIISNDLSLISLVLSFVWSSLLLKLSIEFFSSIQIFQLQNLFGSFSFSISLFNISFCSCIVFLISLKCSSVLSGSSLNIIYTVISNSVSGNSCTSISLGSVIESYCVPLVESCLSDFLCSLKFCVGVWIFEEQSPLPDFRDWLYKRSPSPFRRKHTGACCDSRSSGAGHCVCVCVGSGSIVTFQFSFLESTASRAIWLLANSVGVLQWIQALLRSSVTPPGLEAMEHGSQQ